MEWTKSHASALKRFIASDVGQALLERLRNGGPSMREAVTTEHAALIGSRRAERDEVLEEILSSAEWNDSPGDQGESHTVL
jgi:hypothetical protein